MTLLLTILIFFNFIILNNGQSDLFWSHCAKDDAKWFYKNSIFIKTWLKSIVETGNKCPSQHYKILYYEYNKHHTLVDLITRIDPESGQPIG